MLKRLLGLETEYAIRFSPSSSAPAPGNHVVYEAWRDAISEIVRTREAASGYGQEGHFTQNGGAFRYEVLPYAYEGGLLEAATPECRGPGQLLLYQKAQDALLLRARPLAERKLRSRGHAGELGLLKNCRDAEGNVYGAQENYDTEFASGAALWMWRVGLTLLLPLVLVTGLLHWAVLLGVMVLYFGVALVMVTFVVVAPRSRLGRRFGPQLEGESLLFSRTIGWVLYLTQLLVWWPVTCGFAVLTHAFAFRNVRRGIEAFLLSRSVVTGAGTLERDGRFGLSEKGPSIRHRMRWTIRPVDRPVFDTGNLMKDLCAATFLQRGRFRRLYRSRQRMQLGLSDSNVAQVAEYLKIGTTALMVDLAERGELDDAPRLERPIRALHTLVADPSLQAKVPVRGGNDMTALELQRWYLDRASEVLRRDKTIPMEAREILRLWREALDALAVDPGRLIGRIDWVTKRYLIEQADQADPAARKKIDLKYHELGCGYLASLEKEGLAPVLVGEDEVDRAIREPPSDTPAKMRGRLVRSIEFSGHRMRVDWDSVRVGGAVLGKVIRLDQYR